MDEGSMVDTNAKGGQEIAAEEDTLSLARDHSEIGPAGGGPGAVEEAYGE